jgi:hypothetical protein
VKKAPAKKRTDAPSGASVSLALPGNDDEGAAIERQRAAAHKFAGLIEAGKDLRPTQARWAGSIIAATAPHYPRPAHRLPRDWNARSEAFCVACERAAAALGAGGRVLDEDAPHAALALRTWARGLKPASNRGRPRKVPGDAALVVQIAHQHGSSKRSVRAEIAEYSGADVTNVEKTVAKERKDAEDLLQFMVREFGATVHPKGRK